MPPEYERWAVGARQEVELKKEVMVECRISEFNEAVQQAYLVVNRECRN
jgi:hypothetical protein